MLIKFDSEINGLRGFWSLVYINGGFIEFMDKEEWKIILVLLLGVEIVGIGKWIFIWFVVYCWIK